MKKLHEAANATPPSSALTAEEIKPAVEQMVNQLTAKLVQLSTSKAKGASAAHDKLKREAMPLVEKLSKLLETSESSSADSSDRVTSVGPEVSLVKSSTVAADPESREKLAGPEKRILDSLAFWEKIGLSEPNNTAVSLKAGYDGSTSGYERARGSLRSAGLIDIPKANCLKLTDAGRSCAEFPDDVGSLKEFHEAILSPLPGPEQSLLKALIASHPKPLSNEELAEKAGYPGITSGYERPRGRLRSIGLIEFTNDGIVASPVVFPEGLS